MNNEQAINRMLAEQVMGYEFIDIDYFSHMAQPRQLELEDWFRQFAPVLHVGAYYIDVEKNILLPVEQFTPSRSMLHAWQVVENLRARGYTVYLRSAGTTHIPAWECEVSDSIHHTAAMHTEAEMAICHAVMGFMRDWGLK
jgi:hypothetical protein